MSRRLVVGPFNRVEGDLEVKLDIESGHVASAEVVSPMYRGFERILLGRRPMDALAVTPRICGICSVSQSMAAATALADAGGIAPTANGALARHLIHGAENLADHLTHFHLFFMPDMARDVYAGRLWHGEAVRRFKALRGEAAARALEARARLLHVVGLLGGKWPHTLAIQPGGTTCAVDKGDAMKLIAVLADTRRFVETEIYGGPVEEVLAIAGISDLGAWRADSRAGHLAFFLDIAEDLELDRLGLSPGSFMSYGAYDGAFSAGVWRDGTVSGLDPAEIAEDTAHAWYAPTAGHPGSTAPEAQPERSGAYTWCKAPRLAGQVVEVGALARQVVDGQPLIRALVGTGSGGVATRVTARLIECGRILVAMEGWARALVPGDPFCAAADLPRDGHGVGLVEAARGSLGHWLRIRNDVVTHYQIVAPTTWNFSPRDGAETPGPLERALVGVPVGDGEETPVAVQHVVRSFDPCMVCTVH